MLTNRRRVPCLTHAVKEISRSHNRVYEGIGKRLFTSARSQVKNHRCAFGRSGAVLGREEVACHDFNSCAVLMSTEHLIEAVHFAGGSRETT